MTDDESITYDDIDERHEAMGRLIDEALQDAEQELAARYHQITSALGGLDNDLAEEDHLAVEQQVNQVHQALAGVDAYLMRLRIFKEVDVAAASRYAFGIGDRNLDDAISSPPDLPGIAARLPDNPDDLDHEEWADALKDAAGQMADQVRKVGGDVENAWIDATTAAESDSLEDVLRQTLVLHAHARRLRAGYDEWFHLLGMLSNDAPDRLTGAASATVDTLTGLLRSQSN